MFLKKVLRILAFYLPGTSTLPRPLAMLSPTTLWQCETDVGCRFPPDVVEITLPPRRPTRASPMLAPDPHLEVGDGPGAVVVLGHAHGHEHGHEHHHVQHHVTIAEVNSNHPLAPADVNSDVAPPSGSRAVSDCMCDALRGADDHGRAPAAMLGALSLMKREREFQNGHGVRVDPLPIPILTKPGPDPDGTLQTGACAALLCDARS